MTLQVLNRLTLACLREVSKDYYEKGDEENLTFGVINGHAWWNSKAEDGALVKEY